MEWISVKDRLPKPHFEVEVKTLEGEKLKCYLGAFDKVFYYLGSHCDLPISKVSHWKRWKPKPIETTNK